MNKGIVFLLGMAVGAAVSGLYFKSKYEKIANEEIESVKETFSKRKEIKNEEKPIDNVSTVDLMEELSTRLKRENTEKYHDLINDYGYSNDEEKGGSEVKEKPYVIPPEEFDENPDYEKISYTLYEDGVLTNEYDEVIYDVDGTVGEDSLTHFGEYEDDSVFVRNDELKMDFEILKDLRKYSDVYPTLSVNADD